MIIQSPKVCIVDDDPLVRVALMRLVQTGGYEVEAYESPEAFLQSLLKQTPACVLLDVAMPGLNGLDVQQALRSSACNCPIIFISGQYDARSTVDAMKAGAVDFLTKPVERRSLLAAIAEALRVGVAARQERAQQMEVEQHFALLTRREKEVFDHVVHGRLNKQIAADLGTVEKTVKVHRARVMRKMRVRTLADLVRVAFAAGVAKKALHSHGLSGHDGHGG
jgi:FixJ family two-component response regulator